MTAAITLQPRRARALARIYPGARLGRLTAIRHGGFLEHDEYWRWRCACGSELDRLASVVRRQWARGNSPACLKCPEKFKKNLSVTVAEMQATPGHVTEGGR